MPAETDRPRGTGTETPGSPPEPAPAPTVRAPIADRMPNRPTTAPGARPDAPDDPERITRFVAEIKKRLSDVATREFAVQRQERELKRRFQKLHSAAAQSARDEIESNRRRLEARAEELDAQAKELARRQANLIELEAQFEQQRRTIDQARSESARTDEGARRAAEIERARLTHDRKALRERIAVLRRIERNLEQRARLSHDEIVRQREKLAADRLQLERQAAELEKWHRDLEARQSQLERLAAQMESRADEVQRQREALSAEQQDIEHQSNELAEAVAELERDRQELAERQQAFDESYEEMRAQHRDVSGQVAELEERRRVSQRERAALDERSRQLDAREAQLQESSRQTEAESQHLAAQAADDTERHAQIDALYEQARETEKAAQVHLKEVMDLRAQLEARDAESRQDALAAEVEQSTVRSEQEVLSAARQSFEAERARHYEELQAARAILEQDAAERHSAAATARSLAESAPSEPPTSRGLVPGWWWRNGLVAAVVAVAAVGASIYWNPPWYQAIASCVVRSEETDLDRVWRRHAAEFFRPGLIEAGLGAAQLEAAWSAACRAGHVQINGISDPPGFQVVVRGRQQKALRELTARAAAVYVQHVNQGEADTAAAPAGGEPDQRAAQIQIELDAFQARAAERRRALDQAVDPAAYDETLDGLQSQKAELDRVTGELNAARLALADLQTGAASPAPITDAELEQELQRDQVQREDLKELRAAARDYQTELAVSMVLVVEPLGRLRKALYDLDADVEEQRGQSPPESASVVLDEFASQTGRLDERVAQFSHDWQTRRDEVAHLEVKNDVVPLIELQSAADTDAGEVVALAQAVGVACRSRLSDLSDGGGTREVVIAAVLRGRLNDLEEATTALAEAAGAVAPTTNFRLDAHDRKLRGLRTRLERRREIVRERLQAATDAAAVTARAAGLEATQSRIGELERQRDGVVGELLSSFEQLTTSSDALAARRQVEADLADLNVRIAAHTAELGEMRTRRSATSSAPSEPDRITAATTTVRRLDDGRQFERLGFIGGGAFAATWCLCTLALLGNTRRRRASGESSR